MVDRSQTSFFVYHDPLSITSAYREHHEQDVQSVDRIHVIDSERDTYFRALNRRLLYTVTCIPAGPLPPPHLLLIVHSQPLSSLISYPFL